MQVSGNDKIYEINSYEKNSDIFLSILRDFVLY